MEMRKKKWREGTKKELICRKIEREMRNRGGGNEKKRKYFKCVIVTNYQNGQDMMTHLFLNFLFWPENIFIHICIFLRHCKKSMKNIFLKISYNTNQNNLLVSPHLSMTKVIDNMSISL